MDTPHSLGPLPNDVLNRIDWYVFPAVNTIEKLLAGEAENQNCEVELKRVLKAAQAVPALVNEVRQARQAAPDLSLLQETPAAQWVIVSQKEGRGLPYWRANSAGYADSITQAGFYSYEEAAKIVAGNHGDDEKYCIDDPALMQAISNQSYLRGKELALWLENARLRAAIPVATVGSEPGGWVSVAERLPEPNVKVWVAVKKRHHHRFGGAVVLRAYTPTIPGKIEQSFADSDGENIAIESVSHWQYCIIPTPPTHA